MFDLINYPILFLVVSLPLLWFSAWIGALLRAKAGDIREERRDFFGIILGAALTLLGLIIAFSFSMAVNRYDQRKNYEEQEANAIGTEYARADLLPADDGAKLRELLRRYVNQRISFYRGDEPQPNDAQKLQTELWSSVVKVATTQSTPVVALTVSGMNEVLNSQGYTQAAWWNRIPAAAWALMGLIAIVSNL